MESRLVRGLSVVFAACIVLGAPCARAETSAPPPKLAERLNPLLAQLPKGTQAGLLVVDAASGDVWFARSEEHTSELQSHA
jgi:hypothetical protein